MTIDLDPRPLARGDHPPPARRPRVRRRPRRLEPRRRPAPRRGRRTPHRRRGRRGGPRRRRAGLRVAPQSTGHNAGPLAAQGLDDVVLVRTSGMDPSSPTRPAASSGSRVARCGSPPSTPAAAHGKAVLHGSSPDVGIAGYSPRRRHRLVRPQAGPGHQQPHRGRAGHRRRHAGARRRGHQPRAVLGAARRWRQLRRGHRARVPDVPDRDGVRRLPDVGHRARRAGAAGVGGLGARGARRGDHLVPRDADAADARAARLPPRPRARRHRRRGARLRRAGRASCSAACGRCAPRWTPSRRVPAKLAGAAAHGPRGRRAVGLRQRDAGRLPRRGGRRLPGRGRARLRRPRC